MEWNVGHGPSQDPSLEVLRGQPVCRSRISGIESYPNFFLSPPYHGAQTYGSKPGLPATAHPTNFFRSGWPKLGSVVRARVARGFIKAGHPPSVLLRAVPQNRLTTGIAATTFSALSSAPTRISPGFENPV